MTATNRLQLSLVRETTPGTTPGTPRMRKMRVTGEGLTFTPQYLDPDEIRDDRMNADPVLSMKESGGSINFELTYPADVSPISEVLRSAFYNTWTNTPTFDNDGTADSVVTDAGTTPDTYVVASGGASVKLGHLCRATGFTNSANNQIFRAASSTATTVVGSSLSLTAETAPPAAAKLKVVGFQGAAGDITASATGLASTLLDFTTLGLAVGQWLKIGGTAAADKFANVAANNDWVRISGTITATAIPCDNRPSGWNTDNGATKTIKVWFGDQIKNGTTQTTLSIERGFLGQTTPTYIINTGMTVNTLDVSLTSRQKVTCVVNFMGMGGSESTTALDASPDVVTTGAVMAANASVGRIAEAGSVLTSPNWAKSLDFKINNNLRQVDDVGSTSPVAVREGECTVTTKTDTYFGDDTLLTKYYNGTATSLNSRVQKNSQAVIFTFPRVTYRGGGNPNAGSKNADVMLPLEGQASVDTTTSSHVSCDRFDYYE